ncbi:TcaA NTF2-like domain-containing protein [Ureibacillus composti]
MRRFTIFKSFTVILIVLFLLSGCGKTEAKDFSNQEIKTLSEDFLNKVISLSMTEAELDKELPRKDTDDIWNFLEEKGVAKYLANNTLNPNLFDADLAEADISKQLYNEILPLFVLYNGYQPSDFSIDIDTENPLYQVKFLLKKESISKGIYDDLLSSNVQKTFMFSLVVDEDGKLKIGKCLIPAYGETKEEVIETVQKMRLHNLKLEGDIYGPTLKDLTDVVFETNKWSIKDNVDETSVLIHSSNPSTSNTKVTFEIWYFNNDQYDFRIRQIIDGNKKLTMDNEIQNYMKRFEESYYSKLTGVKDETNVIADENALEVKEITEEIKQSVVDYGYALVDAINNGDFTTVEYYLLPDSNLYSSQVELVEKLFSQNITESIYEFDINSVNKINDNKYEVKTFEAIGINRDGEEEINEYQLVYTVENKNGQYLLSDIKKAEQ